MGTRTGTSPVGTGTGRSVPLIGANVNTRPSDGPPTRLLIEYVFPRGAKAPHVPSAHVTGDSPDPVGTVWSCLGLSVPVCSCRSCARAGAGRL